MSSPPPNPDPRPLPQGWIAQYNWDYKAWFYVNEREQPPRSSWEHPLGQQYTPPPGPPPPNRDYNRSPYQSNYNQGAPPGGYAPSYGGQGNYGGGYGSSAPAGGYQGGYPPAENRGFFGGRTSSQPQQQPVYAQQAQPPKRSGPGMGTALLAGGAGLVGGALLMDAFEDHEDHERDQAYDQGYDQGYGNGYDNGDNGGDNGGGDW
ncbi:uncharacterized protein EDB91DRAFT_1134580 [Suillus paluster]|uniref:uncharacterized protein n=1 Tax=Suillus paluster TaxID=48578 RepID=UPI001B86B0E2|nr:uncharacterized protein EDB91DRAFT_1134580 [Suillus paluster]KAG1739934.1 hypothetical protein EDB91DRAFT_1134580 [Suillus paluster]